MRAAFVVLAGCGRIAFDPLPGGDTLDEFRFPSLDDAVPTALARAPDGTLFAAGRSGPALGETHWIVRQSRDRGASWQTVDDLVGMGPSPVFPTAIAFGPNEIYLVGTTGLGVIVRRSDDGGSSWQTVSEMAQLYPTSAAVDRAGNLFVGADSFPGSIQSQWTVLRSMDRGASWATVDAFSYVAGTRSGIGALAADASGVYAAGGGVDTSSVGHWLVRHSSDGTTWTTVDDYPAGMTIELHPIGGPQHITTTATGGVVVVGDINAVAQSAVWHVRESADGTTWSDGELFSGAGLAFARGVGVDATGRIAVVGSDVDASRRERWLVRTSTDGTTWLPDNTFTQTDRFTAATGIVADGTHLVVAGVAGAGDASHWIVHMTDDSGAWIYSDDFVNGGSDRPASASGLALVDGTLIAVGTAIDGELGSHWIVRTSTDGGRTWNTSDNFQYYVGCWCSGFGGGALAVASERSGAVYAVGWGANVDSGGQWLVRRSVDRGATWSTVDDTNVNSGFATIARAIAVAPDGAIYVVGDGDDGNLGLQWLVRKSVDGAIWNTVDAVRPPGGGYYVYARAVAAPAADVVYVAGDTDDGHSRVRATLDGGASWTEIDDFQYAPGGVTVAAAIASSSRGVAAVVGSGADAAGIRHWLVRATSDGGASWTVSDDFQLAPGANAEATGVALDGAGYRVAGYAEDETGARHAIVRRTSGSSWTTEDDVPAGSAPSIPLDLSASAPRGILASGSGAYVTATGLAADTGDSTWLIRRLQ